MAVHQLKDGRWIVRFPKGTLPDDPDRERIYCGRGLEGEAKARQRDKEIRDKYYHKHSSKRLSPQFSELAEAYQKTKDLPTDSGNNLYWKLKSVINPDIGHKQAIKLTTDDLDQYVIKRRKKVKATTVHRELEWSSKKRHPVKPLLPN